MKIPVLDLSAQYRSIERAIDEAIREVIGGGRFILGPNVKELEKEIAAYCGCEFGVGVASGTDALLLSLLALGIGPGDEVITTPFSFVATASSISRTGATPVFVDIDPRTYNIDPTKIEEKITEQTKAILPVHLYGQPAAIQPIMDLANRYHLSVVEDCAQAIGAEYRGRKVGSFGDVGCFSFYPTKNLGAYGDGGMVVTDDPDIAQKVDILRQQGGRVKYYHEILGFNSRLDELQAAILRVKLRYLDGWSENRRHIARRYDELLAGCDVVTPFVASDVQHVYHQYTIRAERRDQLREYLGERGIGTMIYYPLSLHKQQLYQNLGYAEGSLPISEQAEREVLSLPIYPELESDQQLYVVESLRGVLSGFEKDKDARLAEQETAIGLSAQEGPA